MTLLDFIHQKTEALWAEYKSVHELYRTLRDAKESTHEIEHTLDSLYLQINVIGDLIEEYEQVTRG